MSFRPVMCAIWLPDFVGIAVHENWTLVKKGIRAVIKHNSKYKLKLLNISSYLKPVLINGLRSTVLLNEYFFASFFYFCFRTFLSSLFWWIVFSSSVFISSIAYKSCILAWYSSISYLTFITINKNFIWQTYLGCL